MEPEMICSDLLALTKLYALLGRAGDGETPELLDEKARLLLKSLLDGAAERVLQNHSEIIASKLGASNAKCCSQVEQGKATSNSVPPPSQNISKLMHGVPQITRKDSKRPQITRKDSKCRADAVFERNISSANLGNRSSCRACEWSGMGQLSSSEDTISSRHKAWNLNDQEQRDLPSLSWQQRFQTSREPSVDDWLLNQNHSPILGGDGLPGHITRQSSASRSILKSNDRSSRQLARRPRSPNQSLSRASSHWMNKNHVDSKNVKDDYIKVVKPRAPVPPRSVSTMASKGHAHKLTGNRPRDKDPGHMRIISPTLLDHHKSAQVYSEASSQERSWDDDSKSYQSSQREILPYEQEYEDTTSASLGSYASWTGERTSSSNGESEAYSSPTWTSQQSSDSYGESEVLSSPKNHRQVVQISKTKAHMRGDRSNCSEKSHRRQSEHSNGNVNPKMKRSNQPVKQEKGKGGLRKVKHMFGLILQPFHNHVGKDHREQNEHAKEGRSKSNWKPVQKIIKSPTKKAEVGQSRAIQVSRKSEGTKGAGKNQAGHFLGMLVHVKKAKKPKPPKGIGSGENVKALANKKLNGWQKLHHQTKVKLPNKRKPLTRKITLLDHQR